LRPPFTRFSWRQEVDLSRKDQLPAVDDALLPTVGKPGAFEWCEEVIEVMNAAWRTRETAEQGFLAAVRAAFQYRIWETLSPPPPEEPINSLDGLIRRMADPGQAEPMQIAIRFSGVLEQPAPERGGAAEEAAADAAALSAEAAALSASGPARSQASLPVPGAGPAGQPKRPMSEEEEVALGNALLDQYADAPPWDASQFPSAGAGPSMVTGAAGSAEGPDDAAGPRRTAAQRKRDRLERTYPDLAEAVDAGEMTLKQAYVTAGIEKEVRMLDKLQRLWRAASEEERQRFLNWIEQEEGLESRREYEKQIYGQDAG
jgi:hypothetical protein